MIRLRRNGFEPLNDLMLHNFPMLTQRVLGTRPYPAVNVWDEGDFLVAEAELPGLKSEDLDIAVVEAELTIKGQRPSVSDEGVSYHRRERGVGGFARVIRLPVEVDADGVTATLQSGVLTVRMQKAAAAKPRKIQVQAG